MITGDKWNGFVAAIAEVFPQAQYQHCMVHFMRNILSQVPRIRAKEAGAMLDVIFAQKNQVAGLRKAQKVEEHLRKIRLGGASKTLEDGIIETLNYMNYPSQHWLRIRTNNGIERINREIRRCTHAVGCFPDGNGARMPVCAGFRHVSSSAWGEKTYRNMQHLYELENECANRCLRSLPTLISSVLGAGLWAATGTREYHHELNSAVMTASERENFLGFQEKIGNDTQAALAD